MHRRVPAEDLRLTVSISGQGLWASVPSEETVGGSAVGISVQDGLEEPVGTGRKLDFKNELICYLIILAILENKPQTIDRLLSFSALELFHSILHIKLTLTLN